MVTSNLVRPRTIMHETGQLSTTSTQHLKRAKRSFIVLSLLGTCMFLLILCGCLITTLVLVGRGLSNGSLMSSADKNFTKNHSNTFSSLVVHGLPKRESINSIVVTSSESSLPVNSSAVVASPSSINNKLQTITVHSTNQIERTSSDDKENVYHEQLENDRAEMTARFPKLVEQLGWRLPLQIRPKLYDLLLNPDLQTKTFSGNISIHLEVSKPISFIAVHSKLLTISNTKLVQNVAANETRPIDIASSFEYPKFEYWITELSSPLSIGDYVLTLSFNGSLTDRIVGFYQSSYRDAVTNQTRYFCLHGQ